MQRLEVISRFFLALAASVFLFMSGIGLPPLGVILLPFVPQPVLALGVKFGVGWGLGVVVVAIVLIGIVGGEELALIYSLFALMAGLLLALLGRLRAIEFLVSGVAVAVFTVTASLLYYFFGSWSAMFDDLRQGLTHQLASAVRLQEKMGLPQDSVDLLKDRTPEIIAMMVQLMPALLFLSLALVVLINILLVCRRFPQRRGEWLSVDTLREWKGPEFLVWGLIVFGFALFVPGPEFVRTVSVNFLILIGACYFAQGLAVIGYFLHKNKVPRFLRGVTYALIVFQQIFTLLVVGLGLFDLWGDFRRLRKNNLTPSQAS